MSKCRFCDHNVPLGTNLCPNCGAPVDTATAQTEDLEPQVRSLLGQGQKLEAVRLYKDQTGASLGEAKEAVEAIEAGESPTSPAEPDGDMEADLLLLLEAGKKLEAVKIYRQRTGVQLIEAKQAVEALAERHGIAAKGGGCVGVVLALLVLAVVVGIIYGVLTYRIVDPPEPLPASFVGVEWSVFSGMALTLGLAISCIGTVLNDSRRTISLAGRLLASVAGMLSCRRSAWSTTTLSIASGIAS